MTTFQQIMDEGKAQGKELDAVSVAFTMGFAAGTKAAAGMQNTALLFIKPHANNQKVQDMVRAALLEQGVTIKTEKAVSAKAIGEGSFAAKHYYAIASKAGFVPSFNSPADLNVPKEKFKEKFGEDYDACVAAKRVFSGKACGEYLGLDNAALDDKNFAAKKAGDFIKFGGGFYCGQIDGKEGDEKKIYVFNAFAGNMLDAYVADGSAGVYVFVIEWPETSRSWEAFRGELLGPTDPADAPAGSLRGKVMADWEALGLAKKPNTGLNGVHGSASPFEAMSEIENWCGVPLKEQAFFNALMAAGVSPAQVDAWKFDAQISIDASGKKGSSFDAVEDMNATACAAKMGELAKLNAMGGDAQPPAPPSK